VNGVLKVSIADSKGNGRGYPTGIVDAVQRVLDIDLDFFVEPIVYDPG
jgi:hypothetical protein